MRHALGEEHEHCESDYHSMIAVAGELVSGFAVRRNLKFWVVIGSPHVDSRIDFPDGVGCGHR